MMNNLAGELRFSVYLQEPTITTDDAGATKTTYANTAKAYAKIDPLSDAMASLAGQAFGTITHRITIRYRSDVTSGWRVVCGNTTYDIIAPPRNINNHYLELRALQREG